MNNKKRTTLIALGSVLLPLTGIGIGLAIGFGSRTNTDHTHQRNLMLKANLEHLNNGNSNKSDSTEALTELEIKNRELEHLINQLTEKNNDLLKEASDKSSKFNEELNNKEQALLSKEKALQQKIKELSSISDDVTNKIDEKKKIEEQLNKLKEELKKIEKDKELLSSNLNDRKEASKKLIDSYKFLDDKYRKQIDEADGQSLGTIEKQIINEIIDLHKEIIDSQRYFQLLNPSNDDYYRNYLSLINDGNLKNTSPLEIKNIKQKLIEKYNKLKNQAIAINEFYQLGDGYQTNKKMLLNNDSILTESELIRITKETINGIIIKYKRIDTTGIIERLQIKYSNLNTLDELSQFKLSPSSFLDMILDEEFNKQEINVKITDFSSDTAIYNDRIANRMNEFWGSNNQDEKITKIKKLFKDHFFGNISEKEQFDKLEKALAGISTNNETYDNLFTMKLFYLLMYYIVVDKNIMNSVKFTSSEWESIVYNGYSFITKNNDWLELTDQIIDRSTKEFKTDSALLQKIIASKTYEELKAAINANNGKNHLIILHYDRD
ncbi:hypothetical protein [Ureaplasma canigenitalium]|uniref:hypothetical protein n=1 Tax=Ureaplasma canigenitalium TaxID=42092 RepID=UPI0004E17887|nr:hypothetical protein [Ureaplasma canigenitalium]